MKYEQFLESKKKSHMSAGFNVDGLTDNLFEFQKFVVSRALHNGKYAVFSGTGTGKTRQQLIWANEIVKHSNNPVLILAPLAVSGQTIKEGKAIGIQVYKITDGTTIENKDIFNHYRNSIYITNYEQLENIEEYIQLFAGIALDEASIIKNHEGAYRNKILDLFYNTPF